LEDGDTAALGSSKEFGAKEIDALFSVTYEELRRLASAVRRNDPGATLNPTALVNEAWIKLAKSPGFSACSREHFKHIAARAMRQILVEAARRRSASKRGSGSLEPTPLEQSVEARELASDVLTLNIALDELENLAPRQARVVEYRYFAGYEAEETASLLGVSEATVHREWRVARAWLRHRLLELDGAGQQSIG